LIDPEGEAEFFHETTHVTLLELSDLTIRRYLDAVNVLDKAGGYALQEHGEWIVKRVEGSRSNVIGLPVEALEKVLLRRGLL
jgi:septum formation protein